MSHGRLWEIRVRIISGQDVEISNVRKHIAISLSQYFFPNETDVEMKGNVIYVKERKRC